MLVGRAARDVLLRESLWEEVVDRDFQKERERWVGSAGPVLYRYLFCCRRAYCFGRESTEQSLEITQLPTFTTHSKALNGRIAVLGARLNLVYPSRLILTGGREYNTLRAVDSTYGISLYSDYCPCTLQNMQKQREKHATAYVHPFLYVFGGMNIQSCSDCEKFDTTTEKWMPMPRLRYCQSHFTVCSYRQQIYIPHSAFPVIEIYSIPSSSFTSLRIPISKFTSPIAVFVFDSRLLVADYNRTHHISLPDGKRYLKVRTNCGLFRPDYAIVTAFGDQYYFSLPNALYRVFFEKVIKCERVVELDPC